MHYDDRNQHCTVNEFMQQDTMYSAGNKVGQLSDNPEGYIMTVKQETMICDQRTLYNISIDQ